VNRIFALISITQPPAQANWPNQSGIVIAGFGDAELFPTVLPFTVRSILPGRLLQYGAQLPGVVNLQGNNAQIYPFAQAEMVHSFMTGIDPAFGTLIVASVDKLLKQLSVELAAPLSGLPPADLLNWNALASATSNRLVQELDQQLKNHSRVKHSEPILAAVGLLPKDELATMAETLVALTSFKRRMSKDPETVGGAIDVAVISKGDGFVWIKRKHYFDPVINPRYVEKLRYHTQPTIHGTSNP
jgi:hypothetical protein